MEETVKIQKDEKGRFLPGHDKVGGREKGTISIVSALKHELQLPAKDGDKDKLKTLVEKIVEQAMEGDAQAQKLLLNYVEGLPKNKIDIGFEGKSLAELFAITSNDDE